MKRMMKRLTLVGLSVGLLVGVTASIESAQALPAAPGPSRAAPDALVTPVQYYPYGYRYGRPYRYGYRRYYRGRAGVYRCGPYAFKTHLSRKYCG